MLTVISHDAGGAEVLSSYVRQQKLDCLYVLDGPACSIFERKLGALKNLSLVDAISQSESILCGSSWQSDLEFNAIKLARSLGKRSVVFLDHWTNYKERFIRKDALCLPDEIWVGDLIAEQMAKDIFPNLLVRMLDNPYFQDIRQELLETPRKSTAVSAGLSVLYVCEPIREHALMQYGDERYWGYTEEEALRYFLSNIELLDKPIERIVIRPHPSESIGKYQWAEQAFNLPIQCGHLTLVEEIIESDFVVGCESMAMVIGLLADKPVLSSIPPGGSPCTLPQPEVMHMQILIKKT
jgi:hypothetical protein